MSHTPAINIQLELEQQQRQQHQQGRLASPGASVATYVIPSPSAGSPLQTSSSNPIEYPQTQAFNLNPAAQSAGYKDNMARHSIAQIQAASTRVPSSVEPRRRANVSTVEVQAQHAQLPPPIPHPPPAFIPSQTQRDLTQTQTELVVEQLPPERRNLQPRALQAGEKN